MKKKQLPNNTSPPVGKIKYKINNKINLTISSFTCNLNKNKQKRFRFSEWHQRGRKDHDIQADIGKASFHCGTVDYRHGNPFGTADYTCS